MSRCYGWKWRLSDYKAMKNWPNTRTIYKTDAEIKEIYKWLKIHSPLHTVSVDKKTKKYRERGLASVVVRMQNKEKWVEFQLTHG